MTIRIGETHILCRRLDGDYFGEHPGLPDLPSSEAVKRLVVATAKIRDMVDTEGLSMNGLGGLRAMQDLNRALAPFTEDSNG